MAKPGVSFIKDPQEKLVDAIEKLTETLEGSAKSTFGAWHDTINQESKSRQKQYDFMNKKQMDTIKKMDNNMDMLQSALKYSNDYVKALYNNSKELQKFVGSASANKYLKEQGREVNRNYVGTRTKIADQDFVGLALDRFLFSKSKLAQIMFKRSPTGPGSKGELNKTRNEGNEKAARSQMGTANIDAALEFLNPGDGGEYTRNKERDERLGLKRAKKVRDAYRKYSSGEDAGKRPPQLPLDGPAWSKQPGDSKGKWAKKGSSSEEKIAEKRGPEKPTEAFVASLPAAYSAGSLLIYNKLDEMSGDAGGAKQKGGGGGGSGGGNGSNMGGAMVGLAGAFLGGQIAGTIYDDYFRGGKTDINVRLKRWMMKSPHLKTLESLGIKGSDLDKMDNNQLGDLRAQIERQELIENTDYQKMTGITKQDIGAYSFDELDKKFNEAYPNAPKFDTSGIVKKSGFAHLDQGDVIHGPHSAIAQKIRIDQDEGIDSEDASFPRGNTVSQRVREMQNSGDSNPIGNFSQSMDSQPIVEALNRIAESQKEHLDVAKEHLDVTKKGAEQTSSKNSYKTPSADSVKHSE